MTEVRGDDKQRALIRKKRREQTTVFGFLGVLDGADEDGDDGDVSPINRAKVKSHNCIETRFDELPLKDFADVGQMHFYAVLGFVHI